MTDGGFRPDGTFVTWPVQDTTRLTEAFRRAGGCGDRAFYATRHPDTISGGTPLLPAHDAEALNARLDALCAEDRDTWERFRDITDSGDVTTAPREN